ncbi:MAG: hypothetical protein ACFFD4_01810 [Candidatus Odinarchaeota archaeon]
MRDEVQADTNKKLGNLLAGMWERSFKNDNEAQKDSIETDEQEKAFLKTNTKKLQDLASQMTGKPTND